MAKGLSSLLNSLDEMEEYEPTISFGTISDKRESKSSQAHSEDISTKNDSPDSSDSDKESKKTGKKKKAKNIFSDDLFGADDYSSDTDSWMETVGELKFKKGNHVTLEGLIEQGTRRKKKKKKKGAETDFRKEFSSELAALQKLSADQIAYADSLQRRYDQIESTKSSSRGLSKYTTDLMMTLNTARSSAVTTINSIASVKKTMYDLHFKEIKELGLNKAAGDDDLDKYASGFLNQIVNKVGRGNVVNAVPGAGDSAYDQIPEYSEDDVAEDLFDGITDEDSPSEQYLKYEKDNVSIHVKYNQNTHDWSLVAMTEDGREVPDYPLPNPEDLTMRWNKGAGFGTDQFSRKYPIILVDE